MGKRIQRSFITLFLAFLVCCFLPAAGLSVKAAEEPQLVKKSGSVVVGGTIAVKLKNVPEGAKVSYKSSKPATASVSKKGTVKGLKSGTAKIAVTVKTKSASTKLTYKITVKSPGLSKSKLSAEVGEKVRLTVKNKPKTAQYSWKSSNPKIAKVSSKGLVTIKAKGTATITATVKTSRKTYSLVCKVTAKAKTKKTVYTVKFQSNGGSAVASQTVTQGKKAKEPAAPEKDGCKFLGWYTDKKLTTAYDFSAAVTKNRTLYAKWQESAEAYAYEITPLLAPFDEYFYVKTENPDPSNIRFVDKSSRYYTASQSELCYLVPVETRFLDVVYENKKTGRVKDGYIFQRKGKGMDGGSLKLQVSKTKDWYGEYTDYKNTSVTVSCPKVKSSSQYLIDTYTKSGASLFDNLEAVQKGLDELAVYPMDVVDTSKVNQVMQYPFLTTSPYAELSLNDHYDIYQSSDERLFCSYLYPFVLDSLGFPGMMWTVAEKLDPSCKVARGELHWLITVTKGKESHSYGGAGTGGGNALYSSRVSKTFSFKGTAKDLAFSSTLSDLREKYLDYSGQADQDVAASRNLLTGDAFRGNFQESGSWIRVGMEPWYESNGEVVSYSTTYTYIPTVEDYILYPENVWVDGRYINRWNHFEKGAKFSDYPNANIILRNQEYTDQYGIFHKGDMEFYYYEDYDLWLSRNYSSTAEWDYQNGTLPDEFIMTRAQVEKLDLDKNTKKDPAHGLIYDGSAVPGTAF